MVWQGCPPVELNVENDGYQCLDATVTEWQIRSKPVQAMLDTDFSLAYSL